jgi:hypothetical protein
MAFHQVSNGAVLQAPTLANRDALFEASQPTDIQTMSMGPFAANDKVGKELIHTHNVMFVPRKYIPIVLGQNLRPHKAYPHV